MHATNQLQIAPETPIEDVLRLIPQTSHLFIARHMDCVGCHLARFCTLEDVARQYEVDINLLITDLWKRILMIHPTC